MCKIAIPGLALAALMGSQSVRPRPRNWRPSPVLRRPARPGRRSRAIWRSQRGPDHSPPWFSCIPAWACRRTAAQSKPHSPPRDVALFVDDFSTRGLKETCAVDFPAAVPDAYGALAYLSRLAYVDTSRIAAVGFSQGADTALRIASSGAASSFAIPDGLKFKAAAAFYPPCSNQDGAQLKIPTLILVGAADAVTPAADCKLLAESQPGGVRLVVYPQAAGHCFDDPAFAGGRSVMGMALKYDLDAAKRSRRDLGVFLADELAR